MVWRPFTRSCTYRVVITDLHYDHSIFRLTGFRLSFLLCGAETVPRSRVLPGIRFITGMLIIDKRLASCLPEERTAEKSTARKITRDILPPPLGAARETITQMLRYVSPGG